MSVKVVSLQELASRVTDHQLLALGGSLLHRGPFALARELVRQGRRGLRVVKPSPGYDLDVLCAGGCVAEVSAGIVTMDAGFGLARNFRRAVERGDVRFHEHA
jgi:glutaconate CoA-transferase subunit A